MTGSAPREQLRRVQTPQAFRFVSGEHLAEGDEVEIVTAFGGYARKAV